ncbi:hypothetical protein NPIL_639471 [Nephila pilipes]|uniref:Uncharacterized protein n=1 Tax=Nephila pilipes TaxID=299642 RepID=A0A8X6PFB8_NEPPI|nr:hypothetical protein NPIL_639471 [Nephila pilipes]
MSSRNNFLDSKFSRRDYFSRQSEHSDFRPERPELVKDFVPIIFEGHNKFIIPYSFLNQNTFKFVQHVILRYNRVISEIIVEGVWECKNYEFTTFKFECADKIELLEEWKKDLIEKVDSPFKL